MNLITSNRALSILYSFLKFYQKKGKYTILLPSNICHDVFFLVLHLKLIYVIVDIEEADWSINKKVVKDFLKTNNKAVLLYNHTYGNPYIPYDFFEEIKHISSDAIIIDDRCLCLPTMDIAPMDKFIDLIIYSTGKAKQIDLAGGAFGFVKELNNFPLKQVTFDDRNYSILKSLFNSNIDQLIISHPILKDSLISVKNEKWDIDDYMIRMKKEEANWNEHKKKLRTIYETLLPAVIQLPSHFNNWRFNIKVENKDLIQEETSKKNLFMSSHYPSIGSKIHNGKYRVADRLQHNILNLFIDKYYTEEMAVRTTEVINQHLVI